MRKIVFKNVDLLVSEREKLLLEKMLLEKGHEELNVDLTRCIETDSSGRITFFSPSTKMKWSLIFFIQNLMILQRLFEMDKILDENRGKHGRS